jgi:hypothetical protein
LGRRPTSRARPARANCASSRRLTHAEKRRPTTLPPTPIPSFPASGTNISLGVAAPACRTRGVFASAGRGRAETADVDASAHCAHCARLRAPRGASVVPHR